MDMVPLYVCFQRLFKIRKKITVPFLHVPFLPMPFLPTFPPVTFVSKNEKIHSKKHCLRQATQVLSAHYVAYNIIM